MVAYVKEFRLMVTGFNSVCVSALMSDDCMVLLRMWTFANFSERKLNSYLNKVRVRDNCKSAKLVLCNSYLAVRNNFM